MKTVFRAHSILAAALFVVSAFGAESPNVTQGKAVFAQCQVCHATTNAEKKVGPSLKGLFKHSKLKNGKPVSEKSVRSMIDVGGNGMPGYSQILSAKEKDQVIAYLRTL